LKTPKRASRETLEGRRRGTTTRATTIRASNVIAHRFARAFVRASRRASNRAASVEGDDDEGDARETRGAMGRIEALV
tara:strand:+ start:4297 stop:4530 length:234 start_codon:yes stop_codon:yes gene_type:complete